MTKRIISGIVAILAIIFISKAFFIVTPGERAFIVRFGDVKEKLYTEGLYYKNPLLDGVVSINVKNVKEETVANSSSKDLQDVTSKVALTYSLAPKSVQELYINVGKEDDIKDVLIDPAIQEVIKASTAGYTAEELITKRPEVSQAIIDGLKEKLEIRGISVLELNIIDFGFSAQFDLAIEKKVQAEQDALTAENKLKQVEFEADQRVAMAEAKAEEIRIQAKAVQAQGGAAYVQLQWISKRDGKLPITTLGENINMLMQMK